jgi:hypothetical protein
MNAMVEQERRLVDYLLGRLPEGERDAIERRLFVEEDFNDELLGTLDDLIHAYLTGALSQEDRTRFESEVLASPRHRQRLAFMKEMLAAVDRLPAGQVDSPSVAAGRAGRRSPAWLVAAAVVIASLAGLAWLLVHRAAPPQAPVAFRPVPPPATAPPAPSQPPPAETATVRRVRLPAHGAVEVPLTAQTRTVRLELEVEERPGFDVVLRTAAGKHVWRARGIPPPEPGQPLVLSVPAALLDSGRYRLRVEAEALRGSTPERPLVLTYDLRVVR